jgi:c-di-GMP-binding flagellar brake protein YcgR
VKWPEVNESLVVVIDEQRMVSRVEEIIDDSNLSIAVPTSEGVTYVPREGDALILEWTTERGLMRGLATVSKRRQAGVAVLDVALGESRLVQRREYVRARVAVDVEILRRGQEYGTRCMTLDLSGAGMRVAYPGELEAAEPVEAILTLPDGKVIEAHAQLVRRLDPKGDEPVAWAFRFTEIRKADQEHLIRFAFTEHQREVVMLRRGRAA